LPLASKQLSG
jgi:hypothetical protein